MAILDPARRRNRALPSLLALLLAAPVWCQAEVADPEDPGLTARPVQDASIWAVAQGPLRAYWDEWKATAGVDDMGHTTAIGAGLTIIGGYQADEVPLEFRTWVVTRAAQDGLLVAGTSADAAVMAAQEAARVRAAQAARNQGAGSDDDGGTGDGDGSSTSDDDGDDPDDTGGRDDDSTDGEDGPGSTSEGGDGDVGPPGEDGDGSTSTGPSSKQEYAYAQDHERQKLDVYIPSTGQRPYPLIVFFHGGGFYKGSKDSVDDFLPMLDKGYGMASANYKLDKDPAAAADDARKAVAFLRRKISEDPERFPFDPRRVVAAGASAGGYLAALLGANGGSYQAEVNAVVDLAGPTDFASFGGQFFYNANQGPRTFAYRPEPENQDLNLAYRSFAFSGRALGADYSVLKNVSGSHPPTLIRHGRDDSVIPQQQSTNYAKALRDAGVYTWFKLVDAAHGLTPELKTAIMEETDVFLKCNKVFGPETDCPTE